MTARARITQADMTRALKAAADSGAKHVRIIMYLERGDIEVILEQSSNSPPADLDEWSDDDF